MKEFEAENRYSLVQQKKDREAGPVLPYAPSSALPPFLRHDLYTNSGDVLSFNAYFYENIEESNLETTRLRQVTIYYFQKDDTLQVIEPRQENSGVPQGPFLSRRKVSRPEPDSGFYTLMDLTIGSEIVIFGRRFHIVDAGDKARGVLASLGYPQGEAISMPEDRYTVELATRRGRETGKDTSVPRGKPITALKTFAEATLGRAVGVGHSLGPFLAHDRQVLRFHCEWDCSDQLFGGVNPYTLHFFVADGTVEVQEVANPNSGKEAFPMLLSRRRLPKDFRAQVPFRDAVTDPAPLESFYAAPDLRVGGSVTLWGRQLRLLDCDDFTRQYYREELGVEQGSVPPPEVPPPAPKQLPPPPGRPAHRERSRQLGELFEPPAQEGESPPPQAADQR